MIWLLDVNALIALGHGSHVDHERVHRWFASLLGSSAEIATCAITELGFVRVSVQAGFEEDVPAAVETLLGLKDRSPIPFRLIPDPLGANRLPTYVTGPKQITDGPSHGTCDRVIDAPGHARQRDSGSFPDPLLAVRRMQFAATFLSGDTAPYPSTQDPPASHPSR
jgi:hypothetical protein